MSSTGRDGRINSCVQTHPWSNSYGVFPRHDAEAVDRNPPSAYLLPACYESHYRLSNRYTSVLFTGEICVFPVNSLDPLVPCETVEPPVCWFKYPFCYMDRAPESLNIVFMHSDLH
jgi:hypothetical protein